MDINWSNWHMIFAWELGNSPKKLHFDTRLKVSHERIFQFHFQRNKIESGNESDKRLFHIFSLQCLHTGLHALINSPITVNALNGKHKLANVNAFTSYRCTKRTEESELEKKYLICVDAIKKQMFSILRSYLIITYSHLHYLDKATHSRWMMMGRYII